VPQELSADHAQELLGHHRRRQTSAVSRVEVQRAGLDLGLQIAAEPVEERSAVDGEAGADTVREVPELSYPGTVDERSQTLYAACSEGN
jgi:hypothetical protein